MKLKFLPRTLILKLIFTICIVIVYIIGRDIPLFGVDVNAYSKMENEATDLLSQTIGGDQFKISIFALGITPYMFSMMLVQIIVACKSSDSKKRSSQQKINMASLYATLVWSVVQTYFQVQSTQYLVTGNDLIIAKVISGLQMVAGSFIILWLVTRNAKYGVGGQTPIIFVNLVTSTVDSLEKYDMKGFKLVLIIGIFAAVIAIILENSEYRIPMQRISIHNIYSDKNYLAVKLSPVGMMPVMFANVFFLIPMYLFILLFLLFPENETIANIVENMSMDKPFGIKIYIIILFLTNILFSFIIVAPRDTAEAFAKSGDSIRGLRAGRKTRWYLTKIVLVWSIFSAVFMAISVGVPMVLMTEGIIDKDIMTLPTLLMALAGITSGLYREFIVVRDYDAYIPFL